MGKLAGSLFLLSLCVGAGFAQKDVADTILYHGTVLTVDKDMTEAQAVAVKDGRILATGTDKDILSYKGAATKMVDLKAKTLMPGFIESHSHPTFKMMVENFTTDIRPVFYTDGAKVMKIIRDRIAKAKPGEYLVFFGWDPLLQKGLRNPDIKELDAMAPKNPIFIWGNSGHVGFANSKAFALAGITKTTPDPTGTEGGTFGHYKNGELNGRLDQGGPIEMLLVPFLKSKMADPVKTAGYMASAWQVSAGDGITTVADCTLLPDAYQLYQSTAKNGHALRVRGFSVNYSPWKPFEGDDMVRVLGAKMFVDGSPWTGTMSMTEPYLVNDTTVKLMETPPNYIQKAYVTVAELQADIEACLKDGRPVQIHAEGDQAIQIALDAIDGSYAKYPQHLAHAVALQHVPLMRDDQMERARKLDVPVSFLMAHVKYWGDVIPSLVGDARGRRWCPVASAIKHGLSYSFHFDGPISPNRPLEVIQTAVTRKTVGGNILGPEERIGVDEAIRGYTINAAYQLFMDKEAGSIEPGKFADMIVLSENPRRADPEKLAGIKVLSTYVNGKQIFRRK